MQEHNHTRLLKINQKGISLVDYALLSAFFAIAVIMLLTFVGNKLGHHLDPQEEAYHQPSRTIVLGAVNTPK